MVCLDQARDGVDPCIKEAPPRWMRPQRQDKYPYLSLKVANKMSKLVVRGYISEGVILALRSLFPVPRVVKYICMVFGATISGLNDSMWYPNFILPSMVSFLMMLGLKMHMVNLDVGEMFYNFRI